MGALLEAMEGGFPGKMIQGPLANSLDSHVVQVALVTGAKSIGVGPQEFEEQPDAVLREFVCREHHRGELVEVPMIEKRRVEDGEIVNVTHEIPPHRTASHDSSRKRGPFARGDLPGGVAAHTAVPLPGLSTSRRFRTSGMSTSSYLIPAGPRRSNCVSHSGR